MIGKKSTSKVGKVVGIPTKNPTKKVVKKTVKSSAKKPVTPPRPTSVKKMRGSSLGKY